MFKILLALHLLFAIFAIGPLVHAATTASRGLRQGDAAAVTSSSRMVRIYSYASVLVVLIGFGLMSAKSPQDPSKHVAEFSDTWIWLSALLWLVAVVLALVVLVPALDGAGAQLTAGTSVSSLVGRVTAAGGITAVIFAGIVFLMVYRPA